MLKSGDTFAEHTVSVEKAMLKSRASYIEHAVRIKVRCSKPDLLPRPGQYIAAQIRIPRNVCQSQLQRFYPQNRPTGLGAVAKKRVLL